MIERCYHANAHDVVVQRDVPEPSTLVGRLQDERRPLVAAGIAIRALPVRPDGTFVQDGIPEPELEAVLEQRRLTAGVHNHPRANLTIAASFLADRYTYRSI